MKRRMQPKDRSGEILAAAVVLAGEGNLYSMSAHQIGKKSDCSRTLVHQYFDTITNLRNKVIDFAICSDVESILAQAIVANDPRVKSITSEQRTLVGKWMLT